MWNIGPSRDKARYALAVYQGVVQEVYEIHHWQPAWTTPYQTRTFENTRVPGRWEFIGSVASDAVRARYKRRSVKEYFAPGGRNPIGYAGVPA